MSFLSRAIETSWILRPWTALAQVSNEKIGRWLQASRFNALGCQPLDKKTAPRWLGMAFPVAVAGLFLLLSFASTGVIGAATWTLLLGVLAAGLWFRPGLRHHFTIIDLLVALFLGSAVISTAFSSFGATSVVGLGKMLTFVASYIVFRVLSELGEKPLIALLVLLAVLGLGESLIGFYQHAHHIQPLATWSDPSINPELQMDRIFGTLQPSNPNLLAGFLTPCLAAATGLSLVFFRKKTWPWAIGLLLISVLILVAIIWTGSRGGFLAISVMFLSIFAYAGHLLWHDESLRSLKKLKMLWIAVLVVTLAGLAGGILSSEKIRARAMSIFAMREDSSISYRLNVYNAVFQMVRDNPVVGIGPGNGTFKLVYGLYMVPGYNALGAYSVPLEIAVEQGLVGLFIFLSLLLVLTIRTWLVLDDAKRSLTEKLLVGALLTGILGSFMYGIFDTIWYRPSVNLLFWFMVAALAKLTEPRVLRNTPS